MPSRLVSLLLIACASSTAEPDHPDEWALANSLSAPPAAIDLEIQSRAYRGGTLRVDVTLPSSVDGVIVHLATSDGLASTDAWCPPSLGGECLDLGGAITYFGAESSVGGVATFEVPLASDHPTWISLQAGILYGAGAFVSDVQSTTMTENCDDGIDDDFDGAIDCVDSDCWSIDHCIDSDGDGFGREDGDCDDADPNVYPGAPELCDGLANDCDDTGWVPSQEDGTVTHTLYWTGESEDVTDAFTGVSATGMYVEGGTLQFCVGTFYGQISTDDQVDLKGMGRDLTVLDGGGEMPFQGNWSHTDIEAITLRNGAAPGAGDPDSRGHLWAVDARFDGLYGFHTEDFGFNLTRTEVLNSEVAFYSRGSSSYIEDSVFMYNDVAIDAPNIEATNSVFHSNGHAIKLWADGVEYWDSQLELVNTDLGTFGIDDNGVDILLEDSTAFDFDGVVDLSCEVDFVDLPAHNYHIWSTHTCAPS